MKFLITTTIFLGLIIGSFVNGVAVPEADAEPLNPLSVFSALGTAAQVVTGSGGRSDYKVIRYKNKKFNADSCWRSGSGPCPDGSCSSNGQPRMDWMIQETKVPCGALCIWRSHCKTVICCSDVYT